jgi:hypothetical protein
MANAEKDDGDRSFEKAFTLRRRSVREGRRLGIFCN